MTTLADQITAGVDTHLEVHVAAALDAVGTVLGVESFPTDAAGYCQLVKWLQSFRTVALVGVEGTGSYGAGLTRHLHDKGVPVVEVDRPNRQERRRAGKSDPLDAIEAARAALSGRAKGSAKTRNGSVEAIRVLRVARSSARKDRTRALNELRSLISTAPEELRQELRGLSIFKLVNKAAGLRPNGTDVTNATKLALRCLARRVRDVDTEVAEIDAVLGPLVAATAPDLIALHGVGTDSAGALLVAAGDNPDRLRNEATFARLCGVSLLDASSGKQQRHRLNRGGDRQANAALWRIVLVRLRWDPKTQANLERRCKEGLTKREAIRCLKRYVAREVYYYLVRYTPVDITGSIICSRAAGVPSTRRPEQSRRRAGMIDGCPNPQTSAGGRRSSLPTRASRCRRSRPASVLRKLRFRDGSPTWRQRRALRAVRRHYRNRRIGERWHGHCLKADNS